MFIFPAIVTVAVCVFAFILGGVHALALVVLLAILETSLSFDNAVVNAKVLARMEPKWQRQFILWGIPIAVFLVRLVLPILIVSVAVGLSPIFVTMLALFDPAGYGSALAQAHTAIAAFGSAFLFLVSLDFFFDDAKNLHWIRVIEERVTKWRSFEGIEVAITLGILLFAAFLAPQESATILEAGGLGILIFIAIQGIAQSFELEADISLAAQGLALFVYLNVLDASFSLDEVIAAFAITLNLPIIVSGLGIGALFVRAFTVQLVRTKTLETLPYLEHGAHWAIFFLAIAMLAGIFLEIPDIVTGLIGVVFIALAYFSSKRLATLRP